MFLHDSWTVRRPLDTSKPRGLTVVRVPARFDFIGGWTDTPPYYFYNESAVLNTTLQLQKIGTRTGTEPDKSITVTVQPAREWTVYENDQPLLANQDHIVINAVKDFLGLVLPEIRISIDNNIPKGSGLGGSSLLAAAVYMALASYYEGADLSVSKTRELVDAILVVEQMMTSGGGWQDQIGGVLGGLKLTTTNPAVDGYRIKRVGDSANKLSRRSLVVNTNRQRRAAMILCSIREKCLQQDTAALKLMAEIRADAQAGFDLLESGKIDDFARLYSAAWQRVNSLETKTSIPVVDELAQLCGDGLLGCKIGGAGGGGFIVLTFTDETVRDDMAQRIIDRLPESDVFAPTFGGTGIEIEQGGQVTVMPDHEKL